MQKVVLGDCCSDCFAAINYNPSEMPHDAAQAAQTAGKKLSTLADLECVTSLHTGSFQGFSWCQCAGCSSILGGDRYQLFGLKQDGRSN